MRTFSRTIERRWWRTMGLSESDLKVVRTGTGTGGAAAFKEGQTY